VWVPGHIFNAFAHAPTSLLCLPGAKRPVLYHHTVETTLHRYARRTGCESATCRATINTEERKRKEKKRNALAVLLQPMLTILRRGCADHTFPGMLCSTTTRLTARCTARYDPGPPHPHFCRAVLFAAAVVHVPYWIPLFLEKGERTWPLPTTVGCYWALCSGRWKELGFGSWI